MNRVFATIAILVLLGAGKTHGQVKDPSFEWIVAGHSAWTRGGEVSIPSPRLAMAYSRDLLISADHYSLYVWKFGSSKPVFYTTLAAVRSTSNDLFYAAAISPDGSYIAAGLYDRVAVWRLDDGAMVANFPVGSTTINTLAISPNGRWIGGVTQQCNRKAPCGPTHIFMYDFEEGRLLYNLTQSGESARGLQFLPGGNSYLTGGSRVVERAIETGNPLRIVLNSQLQNIVLSPNGALVAGNISSGTVRTVRVVRVSDGSIMSTMAMPANFSALGFSPDGQYLTGLRTGPNVAIWRVDDGSLVRQIPVMDGHGGPSAAFSPNGAQLAILDNSSQLKFYQLSTGELVKQIVGQPHGLTGLAFSPDGQWTLCASSWALDIFPDGELHVRSAVDGQSLMAPFLEPGGSGKPLFSPSGEYFVTHSGFEGEVKVYSVATMQLTTSLWGYRGEPAFTPDGNLLAIARANSGVALLSMPNLTQAHLFPTQFQAGPLCISHDGRFLVAASRTAETRLNRLLSVWDPFTRQHLSSRLLDSDIALLAPHPNTRYALVVCYNQFEPFSTIIKYDLVYGAIAYQTQVPVYWPYMIEIHPSGRSFLLGSVRDGIASFNMGDFSETWRLHPKYGTFAISPDGKNLLVRHGASVVMLPYPGQP